MTLGRDFRSKLDSLPRKFRQTQLSAQVVCCSHPQSDLCTSLAGFIPPPLIFGAGIDSTCLFWSTECESRGACLLYDNVSYRRLYVSMAIVLKVIAFLLYTTTWQCLRSNYKKYIKNNEGYPSPTDMFNNSNVNMDSLAKDGPGSRTKFIYNLEDHEWCENMESVL